MPYIQESQRLKFDTKIDTIAHEFRNIGEVNYVISRLIDKWLQHALFWGGNGVSTYTQYNSAIGVLECAKQELYRRVVADYEDTKIDQNGEVYSIESKPRR